MGMTLSQEMPCRNGRQQIVCGSLNMSQKAVETAAENLRKMAVVLGSSLFVAGVGSTTPASQDFIVMSQCDVPGRVKSRGGVFHSDRGLTI